MLRWGEGETIVNAVRNRELEMGLVFQALMSGIAERDEGKAPAHRH